MTMTDINEVLLNPVRMRIIQQLGPNAAMTAGELSVELFDVPRTTLYRHINILLENDIITVVSERKVRGSLERTFALNVEEIKRHNTLENAVQNFLSLLMNRYTRFHNYFNGENPEPEKDHIFCKNYVMMMNDKEFDLFLDELHDLFLKYSLKTALGRKARDIMIISTPVEKE